MLLPRYITLCSGWAIAIKKTRIAQERCEKKRQIFRDAVRLILPERLIFLDECGFSLTLYRLYGWTRKQERCVESVPHKRGTNRSVLGAMSWSGMQAMTTKLGAFKRCDFEDFLTQDLLLLLAPESVLVLDNARIHHGGKIAELVAAANCSLLYLPPYSPDFNPIEMAWSWIKNKVRWACPREDITRLEAIETASEKIPRHFPFQWFAKCGLLQS